MKVLFISLITLSVLYGSVAAAPVPDNAATDPGVLNNLLGTVGNIIGSLFSGIVPSSVLKGAAAGAGACLRTDSGRFFCPRDEEAAEDQISDDVLKSLPLLLGGPGPGIVPSALLQNSAQNANACLRSRSGRLICPRDEEAVEDQIPQDVLDTIKKLLGADWRPILPSSAVQGSTPGADVHTQ